MRPYEYRCKDYSLLTPAFKKIFVTPLVNLLPWALPANIITFISNAFFYVAFGLSIFQDLLGKLNFIVIPVLLLLYLIGDHLDGAQAKRTKTGSALGEFCDHYLDAFNNGLLMYILFSLFNVSELWLISGVLFLSYIAHTIVFYEQFKTGWLIFEKLGSLEGVLLSILLISAAYLDPVYILYVTPVYSTISIFGLFLLLTAFGALMTFIKTINRIQDVTYGIWLYTVLFLIVVIFGSMMLSTLELTIVCTLYSSWYIGKLMTAHLVDGVERSAGLVTPLLLIFASIMDNQYTTNTFLIITVYMSVNILLLIYRTFNALKVFWVWKNPPLK